MTCLCLSRQNTSVTVRTRYQQKLQDVSLDKKITKDLEKDFVQASMDAQMNGCLQCISWTNLGLLVLWGAGTLALTYAYLYVPSYQNPDTLRLVKIAAAMAGVCGVLGGVGLYASRPSSVKSTQGI